MYDESEVQGEREAYYERIAPSNLVPLVNGEHIFMERGDFIITPAWSWHIRATGQWGVVCVVTGRVP